MYYMVKSTNSSPTILVYLGIPMFKAHCSLWMYNSLVLTVLHFRTLQNHKAISNQTWQESSNKWRKMMSTRRKKTLMSLLWYTCRNSQQLTSSSEPLCHLDLAKRIMIFDNQCIITGIWKFNLYFDILFKVEVCLMGHSTVITQQLM